MMKLIIKNLNIILPSTGLSHNSRKLLDAEKQHY